jgi:DNA-binding IclR family transcriptional regulator
MSSRERAVAKSESTSAVARARAGRPAVSPPSGAKRPVRQRQVPAVERAIAILRLLGRSETPLGVNAIARTLGLVPSTCLHILRVLVAQELAAFDQETKRYQLDAGILSIARGALRNGSFTDLVQPGLDRISQAYGVTTNAVRVVGLGHQTVVAISRSASAFEIRVGIGSRFPALISATGRCIAAFGGYQLEEIEPHFHALRWDSPPSLRTWRAEVEETRRNGYAVDRDSYISGVTIVAAPVMSARRVSHSVVAIGLSEQLKEQAAGKLGQELVLLGKELSRRMGDG